MRVRQRAADRLTVAVVGVDRDHRDAQANVLGQRAQPALDGAPVAPVERLDHAATIQVGHDGGQLAAATVMGLIER